MRDMYRLIITCSESDVSEAILGHDSVAIGRRMDNNVHLEDPTVSSHHAEIVVDSSDTYVHDLNSTNGTYVNGKRVKKQALSHGDVIMVGQHQLLYESEWMDDSPIDQDPSPTSQLNRDDIRHMLAEANLLQEETSYLNTQSIERAINWVAQDQNGEWWGFQCEPQTNETGWSYTEDSLKLKLKREDPNLNWRDTLYKV